MAIAGKTIDMESERGLICNHCGQTHTGVSDFGFSMPHYYAELNESERAGAGLSSD